MKKPNYILSSKIKITRCRRCGSLFGFIYFQEGSNLIHSINCIDCGDELTY